MHSKFQTNKGLSKHQDMLDLVLTLYVHYTYMQGKYMYQRKESIGFESVY